MFPQKHRSPSFIKIVHCTALLLVITFLPAYSQAQHETKDQQSPSPSIAKPKRIPMEEAATALLKNTPNDQPIAFVELTDGGGRSTRLTSEIFPLVETALVQAGLQMKLAFIERKDIKLIMDEWTLDSLENGAADKGARSLLGADKIVTGKTILEKDAVRCTLKLVNLQDGQIVAIAEGWLPTSPNYRKLQTETPSSGAPTSTDNQNSEPEEKTTAKETTASLTVEDTKPKAKTPSKPAPKPSPATATKKSPPAAGSPAPFAPAANANETTSEDGLLHFWTDRTSYKIGESLTVYFEVKKPLHVQILDVTPDGEITTLFPNPEQKDTLCQPGTVYQAPSPSASFTFEVTGPPGIDRLKALASTSPIAMSTETQSRGIKLTQKLTQAAETRASLSTRIE